MKNLLVFLFASLLMFSCKQDNGIEEVNVSFKFTFNWDGTPVTVDDFGDIKYVNKNGESLSIERLRYLISDIELISGHSVRTDDYNLVDLTNSTGLTFDFSKKVNVGTHIIRFTFGFDEEDNTQSYTDLNTSSWNWPDMLGGGYHFMQFEGKFLNSSNEEIGYAYHNGTARVDADNFEANHFEISTMGFVIQTDSEVEIKMNIAEWFKNPDTWDLNVLHAPLMPIYEAQKMMNRNGANVFSLGAVTPK